MFVFINLLNDLPIVIANDGKKDGKQGKKEHGCSKKNSRDSEGFYPFLSFRNDHDGEISIQDLPLLLLVLSIKFKRVLAIWQESG